MSSLAKNYNRRKIAFKRGKGSFLYSTNGKKYLDFIQGIAVNSLGHANSYLIKSINKQAKKVWHVSNAFINNMDGSIKFGLIYLILLSILTWFISYILYKKGYKIKS